MLDQDPKHVLPSIYDLAQKDKETLVQDTIF